jgi:hypothetical protein
MWLLYFLGNGDLWFVGNVSELVLELRQTPSSRLGRGDIVGSNQTDGGSMLKRSLVLMLLLLSGCFPVPRGG